MKQAILSKIDADLITVEYDDLSVATHPISGLLFKSRRSVKTDGGIRYDYFAANQQDLTLLTQAIREERVKELCGNLLVRHGPVGHFGYYPVSQLFVTKEERKQASESRNVRSPSENWVRRQLRLIQTSLAMEA